MFNSDVWFYSKKKYKEYKIYCEVFFESEGDIGLPQFILINEKENKARYNTQKEWREIMEKLKCTYSKIDESTDFVIFSNELNYKHCNDEEKKAILNRIKK